MASINSLMSSSTSSTSSIYGNSNIISGLASGMDTEAMIENAVSGIKNKIAGFTQDKTMLEWEQEAYRSIIDKLANFSTKYMSFASNTNLLSSAFFDSATKTTASGTYANRVSLSGNTLSDFEIHEARQAVTATYSGLGEIDLAGILADKKAAAEANGEEFDKKVTDLTMKDLGLVTSGTAVTDKDGNEVKDADGNTVYAATMKFNGEDIEIRSDDTLETVLGKISNKAGVNATYSETTGKFYIKSKESGEAGNFNDAAGYDELATKLFGAFDTAGDKYTEGKNSYLEININGEKITIRDNSSNTFDIDGMKVTVNSNFAVDKSAGDTAVTFTTGTDTEKIISAVKSLVEEFNTMANEVKDAYTTKPLTQSNGKKYKPLTEEDSKDMSDDAVKKYEEKAKTGLLFADSNLSGLYNELRSAISDIDLEAIGIKTAYANGKTTLVLDEDKLRTAVETDLDKVKDTLTREPRDEKDQGGLMYRLQQTTDKYARTTGSTKGILIELAGSEKSPASLSNNSYKGKMDRLQEQIERWQNKLSDKVDYYTRQFTALEKLISEMNSQSSSLYSMMGY